MKKIILLMVWLIGSQAYAQHTLTISNNLMRNADEIDMQPMMFSFGGEGGGNTVWNFSNIEKLSGSHEINIRQDSLMNFLKTEDSGISTFILIGNRLQQTRFEDRLKIINYRMPKLAIYYPLQYGDSVISAFSGYGTYCGNHQIMERGQVCIKADGYGTLILSEKDTLNNVLRVYTVTTKSIAMDIDSTALDTARLKQEIEERYDWYARGYRYPLYETIQRTSYSNMTPIATKSFAYRLLPDSMNIKQDSKNDSILKKDSIGREQEKFHEEDVIHYQVHKNGDDINIDYTLDKNASITGLVSDIMGIVYRKAKQEGISGEQLSMHFNCSDLHRGQYILYINVNGKIYNHKFSL